MIATLITLITLIVILFILVGILCYKVFKNPKKEDTEVNVSEYLNKLKSMPNITSIDPNNQLLQDIIETSKLENWNIEIDDDSTSYNKAYNFVITNLNSSIRIASVLRIYKGPESKKDEPIRIGYFIVTKGADTGNGKSITYNMENHKSPEFYLALNYLWDCMLQDNQSKFDEHLEHLKETKDSIEKELKLLHRNKSLQSILN